MSASRIVVMIPTAGRPELLRRTLGSIANCRIPDLYDGLMVVENGPRQGAETIVRAFAGGVLRVQYLHSPEPNKSRALNFARQELRGNELILFADDDIRVAESWLEAYAVASAGTEHGLMFGGPFGVDYEQEPPEWLKRYLPTSALGKSREEWVSRGTEPLGFLGFNWAAYETDLAAVGGFNEEVGPGTAATGQEADMQYRLWNAGVRERFIPDGYVWHYIPTHRCSPRWLVQRGFRRGCSRGLRERNGRLPSAGGRPRAVAESLIGCAKHLGIGHIVRRSRTADEVQVFKHQYYLHYHLGRLRGLLGIAYEPDWAAWDDANGTPL